MTTVTSTRTLEFQGKGMWRAMALTKKTRLTIKIDQRQFMGHSNAFSEDWNNHVTQEILTRFKNL